MGTFSGSGAGETEGDLRVRVLTAPWLHVQQQPSLPLHLIEKEKERRREKDRISLKGPPLSSLHLSS